MDTSDNRITVDRSSDMTIVHIPKELFSTPLFKLRVKRFISSSDADTTVLDEDLSMDEISSAINALKELAARYDKGFELSERFKEYRSRQENHIRERRKLGSQIKCRKEYIDLGFREFSDCVHNGMIRNLRDQQMWDAYFMCVLNRSCNFSVPGSGKTASALGTYAYLRSHGFVERLLIIGPISCFGSWLDEYEACFGKQPMSYNVQDQKNRDVVQYQLRLDTGNVELFLFNYESIPGCSDALKRYVLSDDRTMVILDEVHRIKAVDGQRAKATMGLVKDSRYIIAMTGTPIPNSYKDIYNLFNIIFGKNYNSFLGREANELGSIRSEYDPLVRAINDSINPFFCRTTKDDLNVPPAEPDIICNAVATDYECDMIERLKTEFYDKKITLLIRILQSESDPRMVFDALNRRDIENMELEETTKDILTDGLRGFDAPPDGFMTSKTMACIDLVTSLIEEGKTVIIWCVFIRSIKNIAEILSGYGIKVESIYGEVPTSERQEIVKRFKTGELQVLVANPHTLAESVSLHTVCHDAVYFEYTYNLVHFIQSKDRIHRLGLSEDQYTRFHILRTVHMMEDGAASLDEIIYDRLQYKNGLMMNAIERDVLEIMPSDEDDLDAVMAELFESYRK